MVLIRSHSRSSRTIAPQSILLLIPTLCSSFYYNDPHSMLSSWSSFHRVAIYSILTLLISLYWTLFYPSAPHLIKMVLIQSPCSPFRSAAPQFILLFPITSYGSSSHSYLILLFLIISLLFFLFLIWYCCSSFHPTAPHSTYSIAHHYRRFLFI